ncbi:MAG: hypothetical protein RL215_1005 [Planctomycetota bacterium]
MHTVDLNCDLGELEDVPGQTLEDQLLVHVSSVNVACGGHAGSWTRLRQIAAACVQSGTAFGAHPSYPDREGFGRRDMQLPPEQLLESLVQQIQLAGRAARDAGLPLAHVKPHGALYNNACRCVQVADSVIEAVRLAAPDAALVVLAGSPIVDRAQQRGVAVLQEVFADRAYAADGTLLPRNLPRAVITEPDAVSQRLIGILKTGTIPCADGSVCIARTDTVCVHSDTPNALGIVQHLRQALTEAGIRIAAIKAPMKDQARSPLAQ